MMIFALTSVFVSCSSNEEKPEVNITTSVAPSDGLDLKLVGALIQDGKCKSAEDLERELNKPGGINNLDLDNDKKTDFINVTENDSKGNNNVKSFDLTTGKEGDLTHLATVEIQKNGKEYDINMSGNQQVYGNNSNYTTHCGPSFGEMMFCAWLFQPRMPYYHPYYHPGYYPRYYGAGYVRPMVVSKTAYTQRTSVQRKSTTSFKQSTTPTSKVKSTNAGKVNTSTRTSINNHNANVKAMNSRRNSSVSKGGFSSKSSGSSSSSRSSSSSSSSRSSGSSRSFGSSSRSSSSSSRSSGGSRRCDSTFKENIKAFEYNDEILKLKTVTYNYKDTAQYGNKKHIGFLAQDVQKIVPEAVYKDSLGLMLDYNQIVSLLVVQSQKQNTEFTDYKETMKRVIWLILLLILVLSATFLYLNYKK